LEGDIVAIKFDSAGRPHHRRFNEDLLGWAIRSLGLGHGSDIADYIQPCADFQQFALDGLEKIIDADDRRC